MILSFEIPDAQAARLVEAICGLGNYQATLPDGRGGTIPNPQTKPQFARERVRHYLISRVKTWEEDQAAAAARANVTNVTIT